MQNSLPRPDSTVPGTRRVVLFSLLGYGYIAGVLLVGLGVPAAIVAIGALVRTGGGVVTLMLKLGFPFLLVSYKVVRSMFLKFAPPPGRELSTGECPAFFAELEAMRRKVQSDRVHSVHLTDELNASMSSVPRFGFAGGSVNRLTLGLPLLLSLAPEELRAVVAHELGHSSRSHGRVGTWIYKQKYRWMQLYESYKADNSALGNFLFNRFLNWYWPRFNQLSFGLARAQEFEADQVSAELTSAAHARAALVKFHCVADVVVPAFWNNVWAESRHQPLPPPDVYVMLSNQLKQVNWPNSMERLSSAPPRPRSEYDTHPSLHDRVYALGTEPVTVAPHTVNAAESIFGPRVEQLLLDYSRAWALEVRAKWESNYKEYSEGAAELRALEANPLDTLAEKDLERVADLRFGLHDDPEPALAAATLGHRKFPKNLRFAFLVGRVLCIEKKDPAGVPYLEEVAQAERGSAVTCHRLLEAHFAMTGNTGVAEQHSRRADELAFEDQKAAEERATIEFTSEFLPHGLDNATVARVRDAVSKVPEVTEAYLVRKKVKFRPDKDFFLLAYIFRKPWTNSSQEKLMGEIHQRLLPVLGTLKGEAMVVALNYKDNTKLKPGVKFVKGAKVSSP